VEAVLEAATDLLAARSLSAVSIRDIAAKAGVNHGLIHRHFGSKRNLVRAVVARNDQRLQAAITEATGFRGMLEAGALTVEKDPRLWRIPARLLMDDEVEFLDEFPRSAVASLVAAAAADTEWERTHQVTAGEATFLVMCLSLGVAMLGKYIGPSLGVSEPALPNMVQTVFAAVDRVRVEP